MVGDPQEHRGALAVRSAIETMETVQADSVQTAAAANDGLQAAAAACARRLAESFGSLPFLFTDDVGQVIYRPDVSPIVDVERFEPQLRSLARGRAAECLAAESAVSIWAMPLLCDHSPVIAVAPFLSDLGPAHPDAVTEICGCSPAAAAAWLADAWLWPDAGLRAMLAALVERDQARLRCGDLTTESDRLASHLSQTFEELVLINRLATNFGLDKPAADLCGSLPESLGGCIRAKTLVVMTHHPRAVFQAGVPVDEPRLMQLLDTVRRKESQGQPFVIPKVLNDLNDCSMGEEPLQSLIVVDVVDDSKVAATLVAIDQLKDEELGTVEADLLQSVAGMLGVFFGNQRLFGETHQLFEDAVKALVGAIDAKDPYTCGHSNRVAELSQWLAGQLGETSEFCETIYMTGLLHDIGKIGIDDAVLRKPGRLSDEEFAHIKRHPDLGCRILKGIKQFEKMLPGVRHHHESWDGSGYPDGLVGNAIPRMAQIIAVADSFDAMISSRPYRDGMPLDKVLRILREGRGQQWADDVIDVMLARHVEAIQLVAGSSEAISLGIR